VINAGSAAYFVKEEREEVKEGVQRMKRKVRKSVKMKYSIKIQEYFTSLCPESSVAVALYICVGPAHILNLEFFI
jgi:hypothetical protein